MERAMRHVLVGCSIAGFLYPKKAPKKTSGTEMQNHMTRSANMVPKGTAPDDFSPQMNKFRTKKIPKTTPGRRHEVSRMFFFQSTPLSVLCRKADAYLPC